MIEGFGCTEIDLSFLIVRSNKRNVSLMYVYRRFRAISEPVSACSEMNRLPAADRIMAIRLHMDEVSLCSSPLPWNGRLKKVGAWPWYNFKAGRGKMAPQMT